MSKILQEIQNRSDSKCELCGSEDNLNISEVQPSNGELEKSIYICETCQNSINNPKTNTSHWHCLNDSMWSQEPAVQVTAYRILKKLSNETWANNLLEMLYLEPEIEEWANTKTQEDQEVKEQTKDSNNATLEEGDSVTIIKDLEVKGANFTAKRGTVVKNIHLTNNPEQIEGRVNGTKIVILSKFVKKS
jgi:protein PhnA